MPVQGVLPRWEIYGGRHPLRLNWIGTEVERGTHTMLGLCYTEQVLRHNDWQAQDVLITGEWYSFFVFDALRQGVGCALSE